MPFALAVASTVCVASVFEAAFAAEHAVTDIAMITAAPITPYNFIF